MRACIAVLLATVIICAWYFETRRGTSSRAWHIHPETSLTRGSTALQIFDFDNSNISWTNMTSDNIDFTLINNIPMVLGDTYLTSMNMLVYEDGQRKRLSEIYVMNITQDNDDDPYGFSFTQNDRHLSPFRQIMVSGGVDWALGRGEATYCWMGCRHGRLTDELYVETSTLHMKVGGLGLVAAALLGITCASYMRRHRRRRRFRPIYVPLLHPYR